jgi:hypothetical protein
MKIESELIQKLKDKAFQTENDKKLIESFEIERLKQLTPVEWFYEQLPGHIKVSEKVLEILQQAKEMEKDQSLKKIIYDLDELASEYSEGKSTSEVFKRAHESDFKAGFQKAIELLTFKQQEQ